MKTSIQFVEAMDIPCLFLYDANNESDAGKLMADIKKHLDVRDEKRA